MMLAESRHGETLADALGNVVEMALLSVVVRLEDAAATIPCLGFSAREHLTRK